MRLSVILKYLEWFEDGKLENLLIVNEVTTLTMKELNLPRFKSAGLLHPEISERKARRLDDDKAHKLWEDKVDMTLYRVHHYHNGLVGLCPREFHGAHGHNGFFWCKKNAYWLEG